MGQTEMRIAVYSMALLLLLAAYGRITLREADYFTYRGQSVTIAFETITEILYETLTIYVRKGSGI